MGRESREVWEKRLARWRESGLSAREFAAEVGKGRDVGMVVVTAPAR
jgi:hypothetical protein